MSEIKTATVRRKRRADADRSATAVLDAAVSVLGQHPDAGVDEVAAAAGVVRQTVYAHFGSRQALLNAVLARITDEVSAIVNAADLDASTPTQALARWLDLCWEVLHRYPLLLHPAAARGDQDPAATHAPILGQLRRLITRGRREGVFRRDQPVQWLIEATIALGHTAAAQIAAGRMSTARAGAAFRDSVLRLYAAH
ncbi:TetR/AcrR family transcriptional regulator [Hamadaea tsunoensis]|uniref:TetR/AcrR family transcriptional regulator n=1 Tax=Hamadaea tsunoensis TaxID=53368 RepID=UPI0004063EBD|nr:TetR/AcrR family transcriptional regulator [Hamadaea tsunoensis]